MLIGFTLWPILCLLLYCSVGFLCCGLINFLDFTLLAVNDDPDVAGTAHEWKRSAMGCRPVALDAGTVIDSDFNDPESCRLVTVVVVGVCLGALDGFDNRKS